MQQNQLQTGTRANGNKIEAVIVDFGHGIAAEHQTQLFKPFFTTKNYGLGLGLSICSKIMRAHGGKLSIENNVGNGGVKETITLFPTMERMRPTITPVCAENSESAILVMQAV
jgi:C4-dicarboxylate-specific signal transduction histidine kinase